MSTKQELIEVWQYEISIQAEVLDEVYESDAVSQNIRGVRFVSWSKGKGRRRRHPKEVELLSYSGTSHKFTSQHRFPFDTVSTELYESDGVNVIDGLAADADLRRDVDELFKKGRMESTWAH